MNPAPCRDCGLLIDPDSRGCPRCARNLDAERAVARFLRWAVTALLLAVVALVATYLLRRAG